VLAAGLLAAIMAIEQLVKNRASTVRNMAGSTCLTSHRAALDCKECTHETQLPVNAWLFGCKEIMWSMTALCGLCRPRQP
jgi:hypothetical protein